MKSLRINQLILVFALIPGIIAVHSCKKNVINEVKVPDFKSLSAQFKEPSKEYTTAPFFVWNAEITKEEIDNFLTDFKKAGSSQVFIHPRPGLITQFPQVVGFPKLQLDTVQRLDIGVIQHLQVLPAHLRPTPGWGGFLPTSPAPTVFPG